MPGAGGYNFNSCMVQLKSQACMVSTRSRSYFNSCMVQLKYVFVTAPGMTATNFNSCMVQLKLVTKHKQEKRIFIF